MPSPTDFGLSSGALGGSSLGGTLGSSFSLPSTPTYALGTGGGGGGGGGGGLLGAIEHYGGLALHPVGALIGDVGTAAVNFPLGLYAIGKTAVTNPNDLGKYAEGIVKQYEDYYGHDVLQHLWDHPLQPILDGLTVASGGTLAAAKFGQLAGVSRLAQLGERTSLVTRSPENIMTGEGPTIERLSSSKPITKLRQQTIYKMTRALDDFARARSERTGRTYGPLGHLEAKRYGRLLGEEQGNVALATANAMRPFEKAWKKLSTDEKVALSARSMDIHPTNLKELWGETEDGRLLTPKVHDLMLEPTPKMQVAEAEARQLSQEGAELLKKRGALSEESELDRPGRFQADAEGYLGHPVDYIHGNPYYMPHTTAAMYRRGSHPTERVGGGKAEPRRPGSTRENRSELFLAGKLDLKNDVLGPEFLRRVKWLKFWGIHEGLKRGAWRVSWDDLHHMNPSGRPPKGWDFLRTSTIHRKSDRVRVLLRKAEERNRRNPNFHNAQRVQLLRQELSRYETGRKPDPRSYGKQKIPFSIRGEGEHPAYRPEDIPNPHDLQDSTLTEQGWTTKELDHAQTDEAGRYFLVPTRMSRAATGEFTRMSDFMYRWARRPLRVWRAALLGLRPAFFVNNLIGNSLMYTLKTGGRGAIRDLFAALRESHPDRTMVKLLNDPAVPPDIRLDLYREFFPEQMSGTFGTTQTPATEGLLRGATGKTGRAWEKTTAALPTVTSKVAEEGFRRGLIRNFIRRSPEFKAVWKEMPREIRNFEGATRRLLTGEGGEEFQKAISQQVDHALGNYTRLSPLERNALRNLMPFYAWYRAIVTTSFHLAVDNPLRAQILHKLGQIGAETASNQAGILAGVPSYLQGALPLGPGPAGTKRVLATGSLNPWATLTQLGRGTTEDLTSLGLNPFIVGALETFKDLASAPGGTTRAVSAQSLVKQMLGTILKGIPPGAELATIPGFADFVGFKPTGQPSKLYPTRGPLQTWEMWAGLPLKEYNPFVAAQYAAAGQ